MNLTDKDCRLSLVTERANTKSRMRFLSERVDLLATCVDNDVPRLAAARIAHDRLLVHLDVGTQVIRRDLDLELHGDVRLLIPDQGCIACVGDLAEPILTQHDLRGPATSVRHTHHTPGMPNAAAHC